MSGTPVGAVPGRGSLTWRYGADWRAVLTSRAVLMLQVSHPVVGAGVADHSGFLADRWGRLIRTVRSANAFLGFHGEERGRQEAARLRELHKDIKGVDSRGRRYHALNHEAYLWVHATLYHGMVQTQRLFARPLTPSEELRLFGEWRDLALALGIPDHHVPGDPEAFAAYFDRMVAERLEFNDTVKLIIELDRRPLPPPPGWRLPSAAWPAIAAPLAVLMRRSSQAALPPVLRERFELPWSPSRALGFQAFTGVMRVLDLGLPSRLRIAPTAAKAMDSAP
ncbi:oxygenase MpaB family protein [Actinocorallia sp. B10E7]|uniref:oxygenase MpaB family protein n=1 Tax=Actinocorallia sp. B10E7 TaxID=3153558 RepID=UPI00325F5C8C